MIIIILQLSENTRISLHLDLEFLSMSSKTQFRSFQKSNFAPSCCEACDNQLCPIQQYVPNSKLNKISLHKTNLNYKKGQQIIFENSSVVGIYFIYSGKVKVFKSTGQDSERILRFSGAGDVLGHRGYGNNSQYPISATCLEDCSLCQFNTEDFFKIAKTNANFTFHLMMIYANELHLAEQQLFQQTERSAKQRTLDILLFLYNKFGVVNQNHINLPITRRELASFAGITYETTIRILSDLKKEKIAKFHENDIEIMDVKKLAPLQASAKH